WVPQRTGSLTTERLITVAHHSPTGGRRRGPPGIVHGAVTFARRPPTIGAGAGDLRRYGAGPAMSITSLLQAFATVFPAELPDKSMFATIVLVTRYRRPGWVWLGAVGAFAIHVVVAVAAGSAIGLLPDTVVQVAVTVLFAVGAIGLFRAGRSAEDDDANGEAVAHPTPWSALTGSFGLIALAEWGDLTQLATASLAAKSGEPVSTGIGAWLALASVAAIAVTFGRQLVARVPIHKVNYVGAAVFAALAAWTLVELVR
ncbi:MAG: hypothetical protein JWM47_323, partial [Acidimicrobiales bacterium]|nr:hypothetical protein [Acidimicrobiales bacterium]